MGARADAMSGEAPELLPPRREDGYDAAGKSPEEIEADIGETRAGLAEILDTIERRLAPRHLMERGIDMLKDTMSGEGGGFGDTLRSHPLPLALIGMGVGWIMMSSSARARLGSYGGAVKERVAGAAQAAGRRAGEMRERVAGWGAGAAETGPPQRYPTESAGYAYARQKSGEVAGATREAGERIGATVEHGREAGSRAWQRARSYAEDTSERLSRTGDRFGELMEEHPLAVGALGFLAGAVVALLLPRSETESHLVGDAGAALRERAAELGREASERVRHVAERTVDAAAAAAKEAAGAAPSEPVQATSEGSFGSGEPRAGDPSVG
jgi:hypothetical protein